MNGFEWLITNGKYIMIGSDKVFQIKIEDMEEYAKYYHESELKKLRVGDVSGRSELLAFANEMQKIGFNEMDDAEKVVDVYMKANCH